MLSAQKRTVYLDSAASSQTPRGVLKSMDGFYRKYRANVHRGLYPASEQATEEYESARFKIAEMLNADLREIIFIRGATEGLNLLAYTLAPELKKGDLVVLTVMEHHSNSIPWQQMSKRFGFTVKYIGMTPEGELDMKAARKLMKFKRLKVVSLIHVSNALGTVVPVKELGRLAHKVGAKVIVDAAQSVGHRPVDVKEMNCDFLVFSGHKMFGPTGTGVLYGKMELLEVMNPFLYGGDMISYVTFDDATWNELPWKFEAGTPNIAGAIGLGAAVDFVNRLGLKEIHRHESDLANYAVRKLSKIKDVVVFGPSPGIERGGLVSFGINGIHPHDLTGILGSQGICVRGGHHCAMPLMLLLEIPGTTRASFSVHNSRKEVDFLVEAVKSVKKTFGI